MWVRNLTRSCKLRVRSISGYPVIIGGMKQTGTRSLIVPASLLLCLLLVACGAAETADTPPTQPSLALATESATTIPTLAVPTTPATAEPTAAPAGAEPALPTAEPPATAEPEPAITSGRNDNGTFFRGAPDAAVTLIDYSDFL
jgi:hypothetical protein